MAVIREAHLHSCFRSRELPQSRSGADGEAGTLHNTALPTKKEVFVHVNAAGGLPWPLSRQSSLLRRNAYSSYEVQRRI